MPIPDVVISVDPDIDAEGQPLFYLNLGTAGAQVYAHATLRPADMRALLDRCGEAMQQAAALLSADMQRRAALAMTPPGPGAVVIPLRSRAP